MVLHIFNPEHDLSLAAHLDNFTPPEAARLLRADLGFLPALWANDGDAVLVEDVNYSKKEVQRIGEMLGMDAINLYEFVTFSDLSHLHISRIEPWGWDRAIVNKLIRSGIDSALLPGVDRIESIRMLSSRETAARLLPNLIGKNRQGKAFLCCTEHDVYRLLSDLHKIVIKSPWSCSGRGLRFISGEEMTSQTVGWIKNTLKTQGYVTVEPYYKKVMDFGMEFYCDGKGHVQYSGLSIFNVSHGAYTGNLLATETYKMSLLNNYISTDLLNDTKEIIQKEAECLYNNMYEGPFGVDMMIISSDNEDDYMLHPCVEINLRRTMGHVALSLSRSFGEEAKVMRITQESNCYKFKIQTL